MLVDDYPKYAIELEGFATVPILKDYVYNREYPGLRVKKLKELVAIIDEMEVKKQCQC